VVANNLADRPGGLHATFRESPLCDVCGERCKRGVLGGLETFTYVGDGISDRCVSLAAERRFARRSLALWLDEQGVDYEPFEDLHVVAAALAAGSGEGAGDGRGG
jgi:2-hydroxy-3-keto-5-methylthiopentenyl-1-phosphate phosphatase